MIIEPKIRGFICTTAHPEGCFAHVESEARFARSCGKLEKPPRKALIIGASTGYGLSSRVVAAFLGGADTLGIALEKPPEASRPASAGWYNTAAFTLLARAQGLAADNLIGDAFSDEMKREAVSLIKSRFGQVDLVVYSLASPRRTHPHTGVTHKSCLKPIGQPYTTRTLNTDKAQVTDITLEPASEEEIADTVAVMGGEDWQMWIDALQENGALAPGAITLAYSYIGPELTFPIYRNGTIGRAKEHLEHTARLLNARLSLNGGGAFVSINKALVTQASSAIPVVPLYISILYRVMKAKGIHEGCIEQMCRLFKRRVFAHSNPSEIPTDQEGRIRIDDWEMRADVQEEVARIWPAVTSENLRELTDFDSYQSEFLRLFGFGWEEVNYSRECDPEAIRGHKVTTLS